MTINLLQHCAYHRTLFSSEQFINFFKEQELPKRKLYFRKRESVERLPSPESISTVLDMPVAEDPISTTSEAVGVLNSKMDDGFSFVSTNKFGGVTDKHTEKVDFENIACADFKSSPQKEFASGELPMYILEKDELAISSDDYRKRNIISKSTLHEPILEENKRCSSRSHDNLQQIQNNECDGTNLMKRKTNEYLLKVEQLMNRFSLRDGNLGQRVPMKNDAHRSASNCDSYLKNYTVTGLTGKCILAMDLLTQETVAVKVIEKSEKEFKIVPPSHIPYMVPVLRYHEGEYAIYVVLKYIRDANLWDKLKKYLSQPPEYAIKDSKRIYSGKRFIYEGLNNKTDEIAVSRLDINRTSVREDDISDINSFSMNLELAISECKSTIENFTQPYPINKSRFLSSLSSLAPPVKTGNKLTKFNNDVKSKSLDYLDCSEEKDFRNLGKTNINQSENSVNSLECDNRSVGSDTLSGLSDDFSYSSCNQILEHHRKKSINEVQGFSNKSNFETYDVNKLIQNSKKLLEDVASTLERSKKQFLSKVTTRTGNEKPKPNLRIEITSQNSQGYSFPGVLDSSPDPFCANDSFTSGNFHLTFSSLIETYSSNHDLGERSILPEGLVRVWVSQVVSAFEALHNQGFIWGDFNLSNLLLDEGGSILVTHFYEWTAGRKKRHFCNSLQLSFQGQENLAASLGYVAPELFLPLATPSFACDWWSVGALLFHLLTGQDVVSAHPCGINSHTCIDVPSYVSQEAASLIKNLLCAHPSERLGGSLAGAQEIRCHPFFYGIQWSP